MSESQERPGSGAGRSSMRNGPPALDITIARIGVALPVHKTGSSKPRAERSLRGDARPHDHSVARARLRRSDNLTIGNL